MNISIESEPTLAEILQDPVVKAMMRSDGVTDRQVMDLRAHIRTKNAPQPGTLHA